MTKTCIDAYKNLFVTTAPAISPCCVSPTVDTKTVDFYDSSYLNGVRSDWDQGIWPKECDFCHKQEEAGYVSRREGSNSWYKEQGYSDTDVELVRLDYFTGNYCNLRCAICSPEFSSSWSQELGANVKFEQNDIWKSLDTSKIKFVHFNGGEPLLSKEHVKFLESLGNKEDIEIQYNTNATILPGNDLLDLWRKFRLVILDFSIDDVGERFEYQRYPANWDMVVDNLNWFYKNSPINVMFGVNTSVGVLNYQNINNLDVWMNENFSQNRLGDPVRLKKQPVIGKLSVSNLSNNPEKIVKYLNMLDSRRGTNWKNTFPELVNVL